MKFSFKLVFILFGISAIFSTISTPSRNIGRFQTKYFVILGNMLILIFQVYLTIYYINSNYYLPPSRITSNVISSAMHLIFRFKLCRKLHELKKIAKYKSALRCIEAGRRMKLCFYSFIALSTFSKIIKFITKAELYTNGHNSFISNMFGLSEHTYIFYNISAVFHAFHLCILSNLPTNTFAIFFVSVCSQSK